MVCAVLIYWIFISRKMVRNKKACLCINLLNFAFFNSALRINPFYCFFFLQTNHCKTNLNCVDLRKIDWSFVVSISKRWHTLFCHPRQNGNGTPTHTLHPTISAMHQNAPPLTKTWQEGCLPNGQAGSGILYAVCREGSCCKELSLVAKRICTWNQLLPGTLVNSLLRKKETWPQSERHGFIRNGITNRRNH